MPMSCSEYLEDIVTHTDITNQVMFIITMNLLSANKKHAPNELTTRVIESIPSSQPLPGLEPLQSSCRHFLPLAASLLPRHCRSNHLVHPQCFHQEWPELTIAAMQHAPGSH